MLKHTPLHQEHTALGARMVDFGGWDMPLNYGSQVNEHHIVRQDCGLFDVSHMQVIDFKGAETRNFLRFLLANNIDKLQTSGKALYSCMLTPNGGVIDDLIVYYINEAYFRMVVNAGTAEKDLAWIHRQANTFSGVTIEPRPDLAMIAIQGPNARNYYWNAFPEHQAASETLKSFNGCFIGEVFVARTGYTGEDGFEIMLPATEAKATWQKLLTHQAKACGLAARDTLRLEAGMNLYGQDMDETTSPLESGLSWTVDLDSPRDFIGKEALLNQPITHKLIGLALLDKGVLRGHQIVETTSGQGEITSGSFSPTLNQSIALARIPQQIQIGDTVSVVIRDKMLSAKVVKYPFVRNGKKLV